MSKIEQYPVVNPVGGDKIIITQVNGNPPDATKNITVQSIVDLVPPPPPQAPPTITATKLLYGDATNVGVDTDKLSYISGGLGSVAEDTVVIDGTMSLTATSINDSGSLDIGSEIGSAYVNSIMVGQQINDLGGATASGSTMVGKILARNATSINASHLFGTDLATAANAVEGSILIGRGTANITTGDITGTIVIGRASLQDNLTTCKDNIVIGDFAASGPDEAEENIVMGRSTLQQVDSATQNVIIGSEAARDMNWSGPGTTTADENVIIGHSAAIRCGDEFNTSNTFIGAFTAANVNQGTTNNEVNEKNTFLGTRAGLNLGLGNPNQQSVNDNVLIGYRAGGNGASNNVQAYEHNIYIGSDAGLEAAGVGNIGIGQNANVSGNLGFYNTALGVNALQSQTGGDFNVAVGNDALQQMQTATNNTAIGKAAGSTVVGFSNTTALGHNSQPQASDEIVLGDNAVTTLRCNTQVISALSDVRDKDNIEELSCGLEFIMDLEPVSWDWERRDGTMKGKKGSGFVAQEIDEVVQDWEAEDILPSLVNKNNPDAWEVGNAALIPVLVKAIQELKAELDECKAGK